ncbi:hypothetical protein QYM36_002900 [Artemia franciscana]|uniref:Trafficking protein particle complex subunit 2-like protein n=1 Tax=Artemia franciscana TaxID=6661 RepID=A0AA88I6Z5_ARTSF|nr:hypothetical protein QYM36_002900 [Artemia franciscana]CAG4635821.1 EOG090X0HN8 [Artemia franciscana]
MALCVGVISSKNEPLIISCKNKEEELNFQYMLHTSLDFIDGKLSSATKASDARDLYLGLLNSNEDAKIFGYVTNTGVKFMIIISAFDTSIREIDIRAMFRSLHSSYINLASNPFYIPGNAIASKKFIAILDRMVNQSVI